MSQENHQPGIPESRLQANFTQAKSGMWTEIGEAQITHTLFGRAKVRIIRKHDKFRRTLWLSGFALVAVAALVWQGWITAQQMESQQSADFVPAPVTEKSPVAEPVALFANSVVPAPTPAPTLPVKNKPAIATETVASAFAARSGVPTASSLNATSSTPTSVLPANKPLAAPLVTPAKSPADAPQAVPTAAIKLPLAGVQPRTVPATLPSAPALNKAAGGQPAASSPAAASPAAPLNKESMPPLIDKKLASPITTPN
jgi:hypothetical protein